MDITVVDSDKPSIERSKKLDFMSRSSKPCAADENCCKKTTRIINARLFHSGKVMCAAFA